MDNRVDFYQSGVEGLALPAGRALVFVDGAVCPYLEVVEVVRAGWGEFGGAKFAYNSAGYGQGEMVGAEDIEGVVPVSSRVSIEVEYNGLHPGSGSMTLTIFVGRVERIETRSDGDSGEMVEIVARDFSGVMEQVTVFGQKVRDVGGSVVTLPSAATIFNADKQGNATVELVDHQGVQGRLFGMGTSSVMRWSYADAIYYLLTAYLPAGQLVVPGRAMLGALTGEREIHELDVSGDSLLEAVRKCCDGCGLEFKFTPVVIAEQRREAIEFHRKGQGRTVELNVQSGGEQLSISRTNVFSYESKRDLWPVTNRYIGQGDYKVFEGTFELVMAWDPALESADYDRYSPLTNPDFESVRDVYRKWCLNEAGDYSGEPYNAGPAYNFSNVFGADAFVHRRRQFGKTLSCDGDGRSFGYVLEISYNSGADWWPYPFGFDVFEDECGLWLDSDELDEDVWEAAFNGTIRLRLTATVVSDSRLSCTVSDGPVGSVIPVVDHVVTRPSEYKYRRVSGTSVLLGSEADEVDDSQALAEYVRNMAANGSAVIETVDIKTGYLCFGFDVGDIVTSSPESRDIFSVRRDNRSTVQIEKVRMDFEKQRTEIRARRKRRMYL